MAETPRTAQQMAEQREISISQFFEKNRHLLGYDNKIKALLTIVKEGVDNSLDATEEARILPDLYVNIEELEKEKYKIIIKDNGPGILKKHIPNVFGSCSTEASSTGFVKAAVSRESGYPDASCTRSSRQASPP